MEAKKQPYYVGLLSAASLHGASHQQPQDFKWSQPPPCDRSNRAPANSLFTKRSIEKNARDRYENPTGMIHVSTPEATVFDLVRFSKVAGHLGNVATVISDLAEKLTPEAMLKTAQHAGETPRFSVLVIFLSWWVPKPWLPSCGMACHTIIQSGFRSGPVVQLLPQAQFQMEHPVNETIAVES